MSNEINEHSCNCGENCGCENHGNANLQLVHLGDEEIYLSNEEAKHMFSLPLDISSKIWRECLIDEGDYTTLVNVLFTAHKVDEAWEVIENHKEEIDFNVIFNADQENPCPFFQLKRDAVEVYKYLYDNNIIDDLSYGYFQVLSGKLSDLDFWKSFMEGKTVTDKFRTIHECFNGNNPFELGLVVLDEESEKFMLEGIAGDELLDEFIIGQYPAIFFDSALLMKLMETKHLAYINYPKYYGIVLQMINTDISNMKDEDVDYKEIYDNFWTNAHMVLGSRIMEIPVNDEASLDSFINSVVCREIVVDISDKSNVISNNIVGDTEVDIVALTREVNNNKLMLNTILINSIAFMNYPYRYKNMMESIGYVDKSGTMPTISAVDCIFENNYSYVLSYKLLDFVDCDGFIIKYPFPAIMNCIYDTKDNMIFIDGKCKPYDESDLDEFEFAWNYLYSKEIDDNIFSKCSSITEYEELVYAIKDFNDRIQLFLNGGVE